MIRNQRGMAISSIQRRALKSFQNILVLGRNSELSKKPMISLEMDLYGLFRHRDICLGIWCVVAVSRVESGLSLGAIAHIHGTLNIN